MIEIRVMEITLYFHVFTDGPYNFGEVVFSKYMKIDKLFYLDLISLLFRTVLSFTAKLILQIIMLLRLNNKIVTLFRSKT